MAKFTWRVSDGYVGHGPQETHVDDDDLADCETDEEREKLIEDTIQDDFEQKVSWSRE